MRTLLALAALALAGLASPALADEVFLLNGQSITGRVAEAGSELVVTVPGGTLRIHRSEVDRVEREALPEDLYAARAARTDMGDPVAVRDLAAYAARLRLDDTARKLERMASEVELDRLVAAIAPGDAAGFRAAARFARERGLGLATERYLYERALAANAGDELARLELDRLGREERAAAERESEARASADRAARERELADARAEAARAQQIADDERAERERERESEAAGGAGDPPPFVPATFIPRHHHTTVIVIVNRGGPRASARGGAARGAHR